MDASADCLLGVVRQGDEYVVIKTLGLASLAVERVAVFGDHGRGTGAHVREDPRIELMAERATLLSIRNGGLASRLLAFYSADGPPNGPQPGPNASSSFTQSGTSVRR